MVSFHMFVATQPRRPLDSFSGPTLSPYRPSPISFPCHTSENSPVSPSIATLPKTPVSYPCVCHTSEIPWGVLPFRSRYWPRPCQRHGSRNTNGQTPVTSRQSRLSPRFNLQLSTVDLFLCPSLCLSLQEC